MNKIILDCKTFSADEFRQSVELAKECGMTHVIISQIEKSIWQWNRDRRDPYPNWGMGQTSIFKIVVPDGLKKYLPLDYAEHNFESKQVRMITCLRICNC